MRFACRRQSRPSPQARPRDQHDAPEGSLGLSCEPGQCSRRFPRLMVGLAVPSYIVALASAWKGLSSSNTRFSVFSSSLPEICKPVLYRFLLRVMFRPIEFHDLDASDLRPALGRACIFARIIHALRT